MMTERMEVQRTIAAEPADAPVASDVECEPAPVAEASVWVDRASGVIVVHVAYMGSDACDSQATFLVWR